MNRKFSVPYSSVIDTSSYLNLLSDYRDCIDNVFVGIPSLRDHLSLQGPEITNNAYDFLEKSKGIYKRICLYNAIHYNTPDSEIFTYFDNYINPLIEKYNIEGFIVTSLPLAIKLKKDFPNIELHTSCNTFMWSIKQMDYWREKAGINVFNPPREAAKTPSMLKEMHNAGFKLKVIVNEACTYGCPYTISHACSVANSTAHNYRCFHGDISQVFKTNYIPPKWLEYLDEYVYCYKLAGRESTLEKLKNMFDAYILQRQTTSIYDIATFGPYNVMTILKLFGIQITDDDIPEKTRYCEARYCNSCKECQMVIDRLIKNTPLSNIHKLDVLYK